MSENGIKFKYFYGMEADMLTFYRIPKLLVVDDYFRTLSSDAKILYGLMLDRMSLSQKNGWLDEENRVYIYFALEDVMEYLNVGKNKALGLLAALDTENGIGLIERIKQGQGKPAKIYVRSFIREEAKRFEIQTSEEKMDDPEVYFSNLKTSQNQTSRLPENKPLEVSKVNPNKNINTNTDLSETESNLISSAIGSDEMGYADLIRDNLELDLLIEREPLDRDLLEGIYELILETVLCQNDYVLIASNKYPKDLVKSKFLKLNASHVEYVVGCFKGNTTKVRNIKKYLLAALFNAPTTISGYYRAEVNHDMPQFAVNM